MTRLRIPSSIVCVMALVVLMLSGCAKQGRPPGGPEDDIPPELVRSVPQAGDVLVPRDQAVVLEFSETMNEDSVEKNLFIVPLPAEWPKLSWESRGKVLNIDFGQPLSEATTFVITVGAKAADLRNNQMTDSIVLSFSTGDEIENGVISGSVIPYDYRGDDLNVAAVDVVAYLLSENDSPDPRYDVPDYVTQTGDRGDYEIMGLSSGTYRLFAIGDSDRNGFYSEGYDQIGVAPDDVVLAVGDTLALAPPIPLADPDTSMVQIMSVRVPGAGGVQLFFDRDVLPGSVAVDIDGLASEQYLVSRENPNRVLVKTALQTDGARYGIERIEARDKWGNTVAEPAVEPYFMGAAEPDTTSLRIVDVNPPVVKPGGGSVVLTYNMIIDVPDDVNQAVAQAGPEPVRLASNGAGSIRIDPEGAWQAGSTYEILFDIGKLTGYQGNQLAESSALVRFRVVPADTLGYITGLLEDDTAVPGGTYHLYLQNIDSGTVESVVIDAPGTWETGPVLPGRYTVFGYRDDNGNGLFDRGSIAPYEHAEYAIAPHDTLSVLSRWTNSDNTFTFR